MTDLIARAYARPPLSWTVALWNLIAHTAVSSWPRRVVTAVVIAVGYSALADATDNPGWYAGAVAGPLALLAAVPLQRWQDRRVARQFHELAVLAAGVGLASQAAQLTQAADERRRRADEIH